MIFFNLPVACCGTAQNSYKTVAGMRIILADGTPLDTRDQSSKNSFRVSHKKLLFDIESLAKSAKENTILADKIRKKYKMKNSTRYNLNALIDFFDPFDIIKHLMIGSEGTLGFIAEITYKTVADHPFRASSLMLFPDIEKACMAVSIMDLRMAKFSAALNILNCPDIFCLTLTFLMARSEPLLSGGTVG